MAGTREEWADAMVDRILADGDVPGGLERLAQDYWPDTVVPKLNKKPTRNIENYLYDFFAGAYGHHRETGHDRDTSIEKSVSATVYHVLDTRMDAYD